MSRTRTERLVNLVICLLSTRRFLTAAQIAATVPGYEHDPDDPRDHEAFQRKFERDKAELRELGVPLETGTASVFDSEPGYRIAHREYALPDILLEPDEAAAVGIAARLWQHAGLAAAASSGLAKLRAAGVDVDPQATLGIEPVVTVDPAFGPLTAAARERRAVTFSYRTPEGDDPVTRHLEPWGVVCWQGRWYVVGHDRDRAAARCFRLSRIVGTVRGSGEPAAFTPPKKVDLISHVARWNGPVARTGRATVLVRPGRAAGLRRWAVASMPAPDGDHLTLTYGDVELLAGNLVGYGADVRALDPPELRDAVIQQLKEIVTRHEPVPSTAPAGGGGPVIPPVPRGSMSRAQGSRTPDTRTADSRGQGSRTSADRLARLLNLVPYLLARPGIAVAEAAADLGVTERQLREDLELLWVCGLPGYGPGDLIDMALDGDRVTITYDAGISRPLRLTPDEALALVVALRMLAETPGTGNREAIERALAKIESSAGDLAGAPVAVRLPGNTERVDTLRTAVERGRALHLTYYTPARDETTERVVDPMRVLMVGGRAYLEAWCRRAEATRLFRVDRIDAFTELDEPSAPPAQAVPHDVSEGIFRPGPELPLVTLRVGRTGRWITEYYPCEDIHRAQGDEWVVTMRVTDLGWAQRFLLGLGSGVTVIGPPELVERIRAQATMALEAYAAPQAVPAGDR